MDKIKYIIFDFDGTLADTLRFGVEISNKLAPRFNYGIITEDKIEDYRGMSAQELLKEAGIRFYQLPFIATQFKIEFKKILDHLQPFNGIPELLIRLHAKYKIGILTSNAEENVRTFLRANKLERYMDFVHSQSKLYGKHTSLKKFMKKNNLDKSHLIYIGDETRDIEAAKKRGIKVIAVTWGFNTKKILQNYSPNYLIDQPEEIADLLDC